MKYFLKLYEEDFPWGTMEAFRELLKINLILILLVKLRKKSTKL